jgi:PAS domain S-box-containing protein
MRFAQRSGTDHMPSDMLTDKNLSSEEYQLIFQSILDHSRDGLFVTDGCGNVVMVNRATEEMFDFTQEEVLGRNVMDLVKEGFFEPSVIPLVLERKRAVTIIQNARNNKKILTTGVPVFDRAGVIRFVLVNDRDVSSLNVMLENLETEDPSSNRIKYRFSDADAIASELEGLVARSPKMVEVFQTAIRAAKFDIPLVLTGASGVGKNEIAGLIHRLSDRRSGNFVDINCGAISTNLLESELFGYEKGAFTGASPKGKRGLVEAADKGTLFLDEVGEIPLSLQVKLLKFLEKKEFVRVGGITPISINVRIIAATNRNLEEMVAGGGFREDLYFRLNVVPIHIPSLAERKEEVRPLTEFFLERFNQEFQTRKTMSKTVQEALTEYRFPGNVRELENLIKRLVTMTEGDSIRIRHLPAMIRAGIQEPFVSQKERMDFQEAVTAFEVKLIEEAVERHGSQRKAAKALGLSQATLSRKLKQKKVAMIVHS